LKEEPRNAWALYGQGLAELKKGQTDKGQADLKAAAVLDSKITARGQTFGLTP
jgi:hypothetical protein